MLEALPGNVITSSNLCASHEIKLVSSSRAQSCTSKYVVEVCLNWNDNHQLFY